MFWVLWRARFLCPCFQACLHFSPTVHPGCSECIGPQDFALVSHFSPTCLPLHYGFSARVKFKLVFHLSPLVSHLCPSTLRMLCICFPVASHYALHSLLTLLAWFQACLPRLPVHTGWSLLVWSASFRTCLPVVSHYWVLCPHDFRFVYDLSPLWMLLSAWFRTCLPQLSPTTPWVLYQHGLTLVASHDSTLVSHLSTLDSPFSQRHGSFCIVCGTTTTTNHL